MGSVRSQTPPVGESVHGSRDDLEFEQFGLAALLQRQIELKTSLPGRRAIGMVPSVAPCGSPTRLWPLSDRRPSG